MKRKLRRSTDECEIEFERFIKAKGGKVIGKYFGMNKPIKIICSQGHESSPRPGNINSGQGICAMCIGMDGRTGEQGEKRFKIKVRKLGGTIIGEYINATTNVDCICFNGHRCKSNLKRILASGYICDTCHPIQKHNHPDECELRFIQEISYRGGKVLGKYVNSHTPISCICQYGHQCTPSPNNIHRGHGMCTWCANNSKEKAAFKFTNHVAELGGRVVGTYVNSEIRVECICINNHQCWPRPDGLIAGGGICATCAGNAIELGYKNFALIVESQNGLIIGEYKNNSTPVKCKCELGHICSPVPTSVAREGAHICFTCYTLKRMQRFKSMSLGSLNQILLEQRWTLMSEFIDNKTPVVVRCEYQHVGFNATPLSIKHGRKCPTCYPKSVGETKLGTALEILGLEISPEYTFPGSRLRVDYVAKQIAFEFDGGQHFRWPNLWHKTEEQFLKQRDRDCQKMNLIFKYQFKMVRFDESWADKTVEKFVAQIRNIILEFEANPKQNFWTSNDCKYEWLLRSRRYE